MLQLHGGLGLGLGLVLGFYSVRHLMNGWDLKYTFSDVYLPHEAPNAKLEFVYFQSKLRACYVCLFVL